jgi:CBS domain-containing protein
VNGEIVRYQARPRGPSLGAYLVAQHQLGAEMDRGGEAMNGVQALGAGRRRAVVRVGHIMTKSVPLIPPDMTLAAAARLMRARGVDGLPVGEAGRLIGIVTARDITMRGVAEGTSVNHTTVGEIMSIEVVTCGDHELVEQAARLMSEHGIGHLPVLNGQGRLVGMLSPENLQAQTRSAPRKVVFVKRLAGSAGQVRQVPIGAVYVAGVEGEDSAVGAAMRQFARVHAVSAWSELADGYEVLEG